MHQRFPRTKLTRGSLSGPDLVATAILLLFSISYLLIQWFQFGSTMSAVIGTLLVIAAIPFTMRALAYFTGECTMVFCDEQVLMIKESPSRWHYPVAADLKRIVRDGLGYIIVLKNGRRFRMRHKDAGPRHSEVIGAWRTKMGNSIETKTDASEPPAA